MVEANSTPFQITLMMDAHPTIVLVTDERDAHWCDSAWKIKAALQEGLGPFEDRVEILMVDFRELAPLSTRDGLCIICHPTERVLSSLGEFKRQPLWVFVSGGDRPAEKLFDLELKPAMTIWFSGVYGREDQFKPWLAQWAESEFALDAFSETKQALFSGRSGLGITATRLQGNLLPLSLLLEAYKAMGVNSDSGSKLDSIASVQIARTWLSESLSQLWVGEGIFRELSKDAALLHGAIKNWTADGRLSQVRLVDLLGDFLPRSGAHFVFDPALDESMRALLSGCIESPKFDSAVSEWSQKIAELSRLLEVLPSEDPAAKG